MPSEIWGVINLTPDSFYPGSRKDLAGAITTTREYIRWGARAIDVGAESTRPGAEPVPAAEQLARLLPFLDALNLEERTRISVDTRSAAVAQKVISAGVGYINDVSGGSEAMYTLIAGSGTRYVLTHSQGDPQTMQNQPKYGDVVHEVEAFLLQRTEALKLCGVADDQIIWDAGIGFGKSVEHNLKLIAAYPFLARHGYTMLAGVSRKSFIGKILLQDDSADRLIGSIAAQLYLALRGSQILRVHDVREMLEAMKIIEAIAENEL